MRIRNIDHTLEINIRTAVRNRSESPNTALFLTLRCGSGYMGLMTKNYKKKLS
jgi:hypothetical protein